MTPTSRDVAVAVMEETSRGSRAAIETFLRGSPIEAKGSAQFATLPLPPLRSVQPLDITGAI